MVVSPPPPPLHADASRCYLAAQTKHKSKSVYFTTTALDVAQHLNWFVPKADEVTHRKRERKNLHYMPPDKCKETPSPLWRPSSNYVWHLRTNTIVHGIWGWSWGPYTWFMYSAGDGGWSDCLNGQISSGCRKPQPSGPGDCLKRSRTAARSSPRPLCLN